MAKLSPNNLKKIKKLGGTKRQAGNAGYVYILTNPTMKGLVKVGMTQKSVDERVRSLNSSTSVPKPFKVVHFVKSKDCVKLEKTVHQILGKKRANKRREFFEVSPRKAIKVVNAQNAIINGEEKFPWSQVIVAIVCMISLYIVGNFFFPEVFEPVTDAVKGVWTTIKEGISFAYNWLTSLK